MGRKDKSYSHQTSAVRTGNPLRAYFKNIYKCHCATKKEKKNHQLCAREDKANFAYKNNLKVAHSITRLPKSSKSRIWWQSLERVDGCVLLSRDKKRCYVKASSLLQTLG